MHRKIISIFLIFVIASLCLSLVSAAEFDGNKMCSVSVTLTGGDSNSPMVGAELSLYYVATVGTDAEGDLVYALTEDFATSSIALDDPVLAAALDLYVSERNIDAVKLVADENGKVSAGALKPGLYFIKQTRAVEGFALCTPFTVTLPMNNGGEYVYDVDASPKTDVEKLTSITIKKVWNTDSFTKGADSVTVQLLRDGVVLKTAVLNDANNWKVIFNDMPESDAYSVAEVNVPEGFTATYSSSGYEFTVTNTSSLIQTGQLIWPIPVLAAVGIVLITAGVITLSKKRMRDA